MIPTKVYLLDVLTLTRSDAGAEAEAGRRLREIKSENEWIQHISLGESEG